MNQDKIMKRKMMIAIIVCILSLIGLFVFAGLYSNEKKNTQRTYYNIYIKNMEEACDEVSTYLQNGKDLEMHYNVLLSDVGTARNMIFELENISEEKQKQVNTFYYCLVKYPAQMQTRLDEIYTALDDVSANLDKGYDELAQITDSLDLLGN